MKFSRAIGALAILALFAGCGNREVILEGERIGVREALIGGIPPEGEALAEDQAPASAVPVAVPIRLPRATANAEWTQRGGNARHYLPNPAFGAAPQLIWSASIGAGDSRKHRITAEPVIAGGRVYTMDSQSTVMAHSTAGAPLWSTNLTPGAERVQDATGGGLAFGDGKLFATTGFGALVALDPASGETLWTQKTESAVSGAPMYADGLVYVVSRDARAWAVNAEDGRIKWQLPGTPSPSGVLGSAAPAITDRSVIFPFGSSELLAALRKSGIRVWGSVISGERRGRVYASVTDISGDPVVVGDTVYVATQSGRTAAIDALSGDRIWSAPEGAYSPVLPVGGSVFLISDQAQLVRLDAGTGEKIWAIDLPYYTATKNKRRKAIYAHYGPVLAGGRLVVASDDGQLRFFSPESGALLGSQSISAGAATDPVFAGGVMYLVTTRGQLLAYR